MEMDLELFHLNQIKEINDEFGEDEKDNEKLKQFTITNHY